MLHIAVCENNETYRTEEFLNISIRGKINRLALGKIYYFESNMRKINVYLKDDVLEFYGKLDELQEVLQGKQFVRCHQSYLVNKNYITSVSRTELMIKDTSIPVSRRYQGSLKKI
jgi:DNA-binding LytR/AlgR family response regulator